MKNYSIDFAANTITMTQKFTERAGQLGIPEFQQMMELRKLNMRMIVQKAKPRKKPTYQLTYRKMEAFIRCSDDADALLTEFKAKKEEAKGTHNPCLHVQRWFEEQFPNYPKRETKAETLALNTSNDEEKVA